MPSKKHDFTATEIKAGMLVAASLLVLGLFIAAVTGLRPPAPVKRFYSDFRDTKGLNIGADVRFGGMKVGRVESIIPSPEDRSLLRVGYTVADWVPVNSASRASIGSISLVADMHLELTTGSPQAPLLPDGSVVPAGSTGGGPFGSLDALAEAVREALSEKGILGDIRKLLGVQEAAGGKPVSLVEVLQRTDEAVKEGTALIRDVRSSVADNRDTVRSILRRTAELEQDAHRFLKELDSTLGENRGDLREAVKHARLSAEKLSRLADRLAVLAGDLQQAFQENSPVFEETLRELHALVRDLRRFARTIARDPQALLFGAAQGGRP